MKPEYSIYQADLKLSARFPVRVEFLKVSAEGVPPHDHEFYELVMVQSGTGIHLTENSKRKLNPGDFIIVAPGQVHSFVAVSSLCVYNLYYLSEWVLRVPELYEENPALSYLFTGSSLYPAKMSTSPIHISLSKLLFSRLLDELALLYQLSLDGRPNPLLMQGALLKCFAFLEEELLSQVDIDLNFLKAPILQKVMAVIERFLIDGEGCDIGKLAEEVGFSPDYLTRLFRQAVGEPPSRFFQRIRLLKAAHALIYSNENLSEIAHRLGFSDSAHFSRQFATQYGITPSAYRLQFH